MERARHPTVRLDQRTGFSLTPEAWTRYAEQVPPSLGAAAAGAAASIEAAPAARINLFIFLLVIQTPHRR